MATSFLVRLFLILHSILYMGTISVYSQCLDRERSLLLELKNTLNFNSSYSTKLVSWNQGPNPNCCKWDGVTCDDVGRVIGLDLDGESISGGINSSSSLFDLQYLETLNLAYNDFNGAQIPSGFEKLANLTYLNMSDSGLVGQIPIEISRMTRLVTLDLSDNLVIRKGGVTVSYNLLKFPGDDYDVLELKNPNLMVFFHNLTELRELHLDGVNISAKGYEWCQALSSLSNLQVLDLTNCGLSGPIDSSLLKLRSLSVIRLGFNNFSSPFPEFFVKFSNLSALQLPESGFYGKFPENILQIPTLLFLDISINELDGFLPHSMLNLTQILHFDLSLNKFTGSIPSFRMSKNLTFIGLCCNNLTGMVPSTHFDGLVNLEYIELSANFLTGTIPSSLFAIPSLLVVRLDRNQFQGQVPEFLNASSSLLEYLDLSQNKLEGPIPMSIFELGRLDHLHLSSNNFNGTIQFQAIQRLGNLYSLDLSDNNLSIDASVSNSSFSSFPHLTWLQLASCKLQKFPNLRRQSNMNALDLSNNQISGEIPNWVWKVGYGGFFSLNLSHNFLVGLQVNYSLPTGFWEVDLHSNQLHGHIPIPLQALYVDYSSNHFNFSLPADIGNYLTDAGWFILSNNNLTGVIPESICKGSSLQLLDLSNNHLTGTIPSCLIEQRSKTLQVLNLRGNNLHGKISGTFPTNCQLQNFDLSKNNFEGRIPESLANCTGLELLNVGNNKISDTFPCWLKNFSSLRVLVLRSNRFHGNIGCLATNLTLSVLQIIDIASNNFNGNLPPGCFLNLRAMMFDNDEEPLVLSNIDISNARYYQNTVTVTNKGQVMELVKILTFFTSIDFSNNNFQGEIPEAVGDLKSLYVLNLSHNALNGPIPPTIGNLKQLGSLDLSNNMLGGEIPMQLATLTFLTYLNLSYNQLVGMIPKGSQLQTFTEASFEGNKGLYGCPLNTSCNHTSVTRLPPPTSEDRNPHPEDHINWDWLSVELGFIIGFGFIVGPLLCSRIWRRYYYKHVDRVLGRVNLGRRAY